MNAILKKFDFYSYSANKCWNRFIRFPFCNYSARKRYKSPFNQLIFLVTDRIKNFLSQDDQRVVEKVLSMGGMVTREFK